MSLPLGVIAVLALCAVIGLVRWGVQRELHPNGSGRTDPATATTAYNCCGVDQGCGLEHCPPLGAGQDGCVRRSDMPNGMDFNTDCYLLGDKSDWCRGGETEGMVTDSVDKCYGPPHSTCDYKCHLGYIKQDTAIHTCYAGAQVFLGGHCELDPQYMYGVYTEEPEEPEGSYNCCGGAQGCGYEYCPALGAGQDGCVRRWDMPNGMDFNTDCDLPGDKSDWCTGGGVTEGMDAGSVDKCYGPPHSTCGYKCLPGYTKQDTAIHTCYAGEGVYSGGNCTRDEKVVWG